MVRDSLAHIALHARADDVVADAVTTARRLTGSDTAYAAVANGRGAYAMTAREAIADPRWPQMRIVRGRGLGGRSSPSAGRAARPTTWRSRRSPATTASSCAPRVCTG